MFLQQKNLNSIKKSLIPSSCLICGVISLTQMNSWAPGGVFGGSCARPGVRLDDPRGSLRIFQDFRNVLRQARSYKWHGFVRAGRTRRKSISPETLLSHQPSREGRSRGRKEAALPWNQIPDTPAAPQNHGLGVSSQGRDSV